MIGGLLLFLQVSVAAPPNPAPLVIRQGEVVKSVPVVSTTSGAYLRADLLAAALGGSAADLPGGKYRVTLGDVTFEVREGVPFLRVGDAVVPLALPALRSGKTFLLPLQVASSVFPKYATGFNYDLAAGELRIFSTLARKGVDLPPSPTSGAVVLQPPDNSGASTTPARPKRNQRRLVVVDAGHGGPDNGMTGPIGNGPRIVEKHVTLAVAKLLARSLRDAGFEVLMTRSTDTLIALSDRGRIANRNKGDLFVSVHVNATGSRGASGARERGYETYFLAEAKTEEASRVERMENEAVKFETGANAPKGDPLSFIINDMAQNEHLRESNDLAETVQNGMRRFHPGRDRGVQQANFAVLRGSYMPAVLVEIGFGTNPLEAEYLLDGGNQQRIASSISAAVTEYMSHYEARVGTGGR
ncbi:MAG: N-acetylmuramoyl-L-alanine amidase [Gemmatimonadaceae bacterium]